MICKWCGAKVDPAKKTCGRCGRENNPLSDCGGFYDVVPNAPKVEPMVRPEPVSAPAAAPVLRSAGSPRWMKIALGVLAAAVVALGVFSIGQSGKIRELEARERKPVLQENDVTKPTEESTEPEATEPLTEQPAQTPTAGTEGSGKLSAFVQAQADRVAKWNIHTKKWIDSKNGPWSEDALQAHLDELLKEFLVTLPQPEELPPTEEPQNPEADTHT